MCSAVGSPFAVVPSGTTRAHHSSQLTTRVKCAGVVFWSIAATAGAGVSVAGVSRASKPSSAASAARLSSSRVRSSAM